MKTNNTNLTAKEACTKAHAIRKETGCSLSDAFKAVYANQNSVPRKVSFFRRELDEIYTSLVTKYLRKGYSINTTRMAGSQGDIAHIDLTKDDKTIRILMDHGFNTGDGYSDCVWDRNDRLVILVGEVTDASWSTIWNNHLKVIEKQVFCKLSDTFYVTVDQIPRIAELRKNRFYAQMDTDGRVVSSYSDDMTTPMAKAAEKLVRTQKGYKTTKFSVKSVRRIKAYNHIYYYITILNNKGQEDTISIKLS